jgi:DNA-binding XRE family transcriptional regulator
VNLRGELDGSGDYAVPCLVCHGCQLNGFHGEPFPVRAASFEHPGEVGKYIDVALLCSTDHSEELTQEDLAELAGLHAETISRLERGKAQASITVLVILVRALECRIADLVPNPIDDGGLTDNEKCLLQKWRLMDPKMKTHLLGLLEI